MAGVPPACLGFDVVVGVYLLARRRAAARTRTGLIGFRLRTRPADRLQRQKYPLPVAR